MKVGIDGIVVHVQGDGENIALKCDDSFDAVTTLLNLFAGLKSRDPIFDFKGIVANYEGLLKGNGF